MYACVARPVKNEEINANPKARESVEVEWARLRAVGKHGCWDEKNPRPKVEVMAEAQKGNRTVHFGKLMELCVEKNYDIPGQSKFKGRVVYRGDCVKDEWGDQAIFKDIAQCPATLEAAKVGDLIACLPGCAGQQGDATQAFPQAEFKGTETWISLPRTR